MGGGDNYENRRRPPTCKTKTTGKKAKMEDADTELEKKVFSDSQIQDFKQLLVESDIFHHWMKIGRAEGLNTDTQIANFLIQQYEKRRGGGVQPSAGRCIHCHTPLNLICTKCQLLYQPTESSQVGSESVVMVEMSPPPPFAEIKATVEPVNKDVLSNDHQSYCSDSDDHAQCHFSDAGSSSVGLTTELKNLLRIEAKSHRKGLSRNAKSRGGRRVPIRNDIAASYTGDIDKGLPPPVQPDLLSDASQNVSSTHKTSEEDGNSSFVKNYVYLHREIESAKSKISKKLFSCTQCPAAFRHQNKLTLHMRSHSDEKPYPCSVCSTAFKYKHSWRDHMQKVHGYEKLFQCEMCDDKFSSFPELRQHKRTHEKEKGSKSGKCSECDAAFDEAYQLKQHMRIHTGEKPFACSVCSSRFRFNYRLKEHMRTHTGERPYICKECGAAFKGSSTVIAHMRIHTGEKPHACKECGAKFIQSSALKTHMRIHTGEKPHMCTVCGATFSSSGRLTKHMLVHTEERPYTCAECGSRFKSHGDLNNHKLNIHTDSEPVVCKECGASFRRVAYLNLHMRTHSAVRPFVCEICGKGFLQKFLLNAHKRVHTGEKPFACDVCQASFSLRSSLRRHRQKRHSVPGVLR